MKYLHEQMLQVQSNASKLKDSETIVVEDDHNLLPTYFFFHPRILCFLIFIIVLAAI